MFSWPVRVYYEDTDAGGVVYHSRYLNYLERARTEWLRQQGVEQETLALESGIRFAVSRMEIRFLKPARLDDLLEISVKPSSQKRVSLILLQTIVRPVDGQTLIQAEVRIACINSAFRPARLPDFLQQRLQQAGSDTPGCVLPFP